MNESPVQALLFDLGGVLIHIDFERVLHAWAPLSALSLPELSSTFKQDAAYQQHETGHLGAHDYFNHLRATLKLTGSDQQIADGWNAVLVDEINDTVAAVRKARAHYPCYVFSNTNPTHQAVWMARFPELVALFERIFVSSDMGLRKPARAAFECVTREIGVSASSILFFDDLLENVRGAQDAGLMAVHVRSPADVLSALRGIGCVL